MIPSQWHLSLITQKVSTGIAAFIAFKSLTLFSPRELEENSSVIHTETQNCSVPGHICQQVSGYKFKTCCVFLFCCCFHSIIFLTVSLDKCVSVAFLLCSWDIIKHSDKEKAHFHYMESVALQSSSWKDRLTGLPGLSAFIEGQISAVLLSVTLRLTRYSQGPLRV